MKSGIDIGLPHVRAERNTSRKYPLLRGSVAKAGVDLSKLLVCRKMKRRELPHGEIVVPRKLFAQLEINADGTGVVPGVKGIFPLMA